MALNKTADAKTDEELAAEREADEAVKAQEAADKAAADEKDAEDLAAAQAEEERLAKEAEEKAVEDAKPTKARSKLTAHEKKCKAIEDKAAKLNKSGAKKFVTLKGCDQVQDPGTKVTLYKDQEIRVPEISKWVICQAKLDYLTFE